MSEFLCSKSPDLARLVGGPQCFASLKRRVKALELPRCPFCGGVPSVCMGRINTTAHIAVRCNECRISTYPMPADNAETALTASVARWVRRQ